MAACSKLDLDQLRFSCTVSSDCGRDRVCDLSIGECVLPDDVIDAGGQGMDATAVDAEVDGGVAPDSGVQPGIGVCSPSIEATTIDTDHWWCRRMSAGELGAFIDRFDARILDLAPEPGSELFTAALEKKRTGRRFGWTGGIRWGDIGGTFSGLEIEDIHPFYGSGEDLFVAGVFEEYAGARFRLNEAPEGGVYQEIIHTLEGSSWSRSNGQYPRIVYLTRWVREQRPLYTWVARVRGVAMSSTIAFSFSEADIDTYPGRILDVEPTDSPDLFTVVTATRTPADLETHFVANRDEDELDAALAEHGAYVWRIVPRLFNTQLRWSALMTKPPETLIADISARLSDESIGRPSMILANVAGSTVAEANAALTIRMSKIGIALLGLYAFEQVQAGAASLEQTEVPYYSTTTTSECPRGVSTRTSTLGHALEEMFKYGYGHARGIVEHFGASAINDYAHAIGMTSTVLNGSIGCESDASTTSLADLVRLFRAMATRLDDTHRLALYAIMPDLHDDGTGWKRELYVTELVREEAAYAKLDTAVRDQFLAHLSFRLVHSPRPFQVRSRFRDPAMIGSADIPRCVNGHLETETWIYALGMLGATIDRDLHDGERSIYISSAELLRGPVRNALSSFDCLP